METYRCQNKSFNLVRIRIFFGQEETESACKDTKCILRTPTTSADAVVEDPLFLAEFSAAKWQNVHEPIVRTDQSHKRDTTVPLYSCSTTTDCGLHLLQAGNRFLTKFLFQQAKTPVRGKLGVASD